MSKKKDEAVTDEDVLPETPPEPPADVPEYDFMSDPAVIAYIDGRVTEGIKAALKGTAPKANTKKPAAVEKTDFDRMTYRERLKLFQSDPQTYHNLKGEK